MHDNVLQSLGNRQTNLRHYDNFSSMEDVSRKTSAVVQPMPFTQTPQKENQPTKPISISPVFPGNGSVTHNITRMCDGVPTRIPSGPDQNLSFKPYNTAHFLSYRHTVAQGQGDINMSSISGEESITDVESDSQELLRTGDLPNMTDSSISTQGSTSPNSSGTSSSPSGSSKSSPGSGCGSVTSPEVTDSQTSKKKSRTNYTADQLQALLKVFHENPYPDSEMMETIGKDLGVPENKIKVWFQNKRARWRRRGNDNMNTFPSHFMPMSHMMSPVAPYGFFPPSQMLPSTSPQSMPGYLNYQWMQGSVSPNNNQTTHGYSLGSRLQPTMQGNPTLNQQRSQSAIQPMISLPSSYATMTSPESKKASTQHNRHLQYPSFLYSSPYGNYGQNHK